MRPIQQPGAHPVAITAPRGRHGGSSAADEEKGDPEIARALQAVADTLGPPARDTIVLENAGKHTLELRLILSALPASGTLVDVGGGVGVNLLTLRRLGVTGPGLALLDRFEEYTPQNRMGAAQPALELMKTEGISVINQDFVRTPGLPFNDASVDVVTLFDVIEHLPHHPLRLLREIRRILAPGGTLLLSGPNAVALMKRIKAAAGTYPYASLDTWLEEPFFEHYREYTPREYGQLVRLSGLALERTIRSSEPWPTRARTRYHKGRHSPLSFRVAAIYGMRLLELCYPNWRHSVYCIGRKT